MAAEVTIRPMEMLRVRVKMPALFSLRLWLAARVFHLGGLIAGCGVVIETEDRPE